MLTAVMVLVATTSAALTALLVRRSCTLADALSGVVRVEDLVELAVVVLGAAVTSWLSGCAAVTGCCLLARLTGNVWQAGETLLRRASPAVLRRAVAGVVGAGIGVGGLVQPALAAEPLPDDLGWAVTVSALADRDGSPAPPRGAATGSRDGGPGSSSSRGLAVDGPGRAPRSAAGTAGAPGRGTVSTPSGSDSPVSSSSTDGLTEVVVAPGDNLWRLAATHLPPGADEAAVAAAWPVWYALNRDVIGPDPDLLVPGQRLQVPTDRQPDPTDAATGAPS